MEFSYLFRALLRRKWIILLSVAAALVTAYLVTRNYKSEYKSTAQLSTGFTASQELKLSNENFNIPQIDVKFNNVIENITSAQVLSLVSFHLLLHDLQSPDEAFTPSGNKLQKAKMDKQTAVLLLSAHLDSVSVLSPSVPAENALINLLTSYHYNPEAIMDNLKAERFQKTDYINIEYRSDKPILSAFIVNTLCDEFRRFYAVSEQGRADKSLTRLDSLFNVKKAILDQKQRAKEDFMSANGILDVNLEGSSKLTQISGLETQLTDERGVAKDASYRVGQLDDMIKAAKNPGTSSAETPGNITGTAGSNSDYIRLRKQYEQLLTEYNQKGGNDTAIRRRLDNISQSMSKLDLVENHGSQETSGGQNGTTLSELEQKRIDAQATLEASNQKISSMETRLSELRAGLTGMAAKGVNLGQYDKEIQMASAEYTAAKDQINIARNTYDNKPVFRQTILGEPSSVPEKSKKIMVISVSGVGVLLLSCLIIILLELFDHSIKTPAQFHHLTDLPLLGTINRIKLSPHENVLEKTGSFNADEKQRDNTFLELLRKLRYEIEASNKKVILFTSTEPQQGKTMLIQSISFILSLGKKKVLIIDTNFCNNDLTKNTGAEPVLEKFDLNGGVFDRNEIAKLATHSAVSGVDIIGCQGGDYTPTEILPKNHLLNYLGQVKQEYDFIFMEGAPLNGYTDTMELINYADGLIIVFSADSTLTSADRQSIQFLDQHKDKFIGAILNKVDADNLEI
jgi:polysaccharide biosynthesis transport protein